MDIACYKGNAIEDWCLTFRRTGKREDFRLAGKDKMIIRTSPILLGLLAQGYLIDAFEGIFSIFILREVVNQGSGKKA